MLSGIFCVFCVVAGLVSTGVFCRSSNSFKASFIAGSISFGAGVADVTGMPVSGSDTNNASVFPTVESKIKSFEASFGLPFFLFTFLARKGEAVFLTFFFAAGFEIFFFLIGIY